MTFSRPYKSAMTFNEASKELINCSGTQFDPEITKEFVAIIEEMNKNTNCYVPFKHKDYMDGKADDQ
jgi:HD-GYP domain-containing protein (c-di-GMP phosphodiesterase class II)